MAFSPSNADRRKSSALLKLRSPSESVYRRYWRKAVRCVGATGATPQQIVIYGQALQVRQFALHRSLLFDRDYLVAFVPRDELRVALPDVDASAAMMTNRALPPLVILPVKGRHRGRPALSILEHEIVHVNQMLTGSFPDLPKSGDARPRMKYFVATMHTEYEANLLQLVRWPDLYPRDVGLSLDCWCRLRGYASALEATLRLAAQDNLARRQAVRLIEAIEMELRNGAPRLGIGKSHVQWFVDRWPAHTAAAITRVATEFPFVKNTVAFAAIVGWWRMRWASRKDFAAPL